MCHYRSDRCFINLHLSSSVNISILQHHLISVVGFVSCLNSALNGFCHVIFIINYHLHNFTVRKLESGAAFQDVLSVSSLGFRRILPEL